jgi:hypothetical protein
MNRVDRILIWELWARNRWILLGVLGSLLLSWAFTLVQSVSATAFVPVQFVFLLLGMATIFWVCCMAEPEAGKRNGFPTHLFILPVPTWRLTLTPMAAGIVIADAYYLAWCKLIFPSWPIVLPNSWMLMQLLSLSCMMASAQAIAWSLGAFPLIRLFSIAGVLTALAFAGIGIPSDDFRFVQPATLAAIFGGVLAASALAAIAGVARDRRGEWVGWTGKLLQAFLDYLPARRHSFRSAAAAQFWWEWGLLGFFASVMFAGPALAVIPAFPVHAALSLPASATVRMVCSIPILAVVTAAVAGYGLARSGFRSTHVGISPFVAIRPISTHDLVMAKLKLLTCVTLLGWTLVILFSPLAFSLFYLIPHAYLELPSWRVFFTRNRDLLSWFAHPAIIAGILAATWQSMVSGLSIGLAGRSWKNKLLVFFAFIVFVGLAAVGLWIYERPSLHPMTLQVLPWLAGVIVTIKLTRLALAFKKAAAHGLLVAGQLKPLAGILLLISAAIIWALASLVSADFLSVAVAAFLAACLLPGPELPKCLLRLDRDRHR